MIDKAIVQKMWKMMDKALFGNKSPKSVLESKYKEYNILKTSLLTECLELFKHIVGKEKVAQLFKEDVDVYIKDAKKLTESTLKSKKIKNLILENVSKFSKESKDIDKLINENVKKTSISILVDNLFLAEAVKYMPEDKTLKEDPLFDIVKSSYNLFKEELAELLLNKESCSSTKV